MNDDAFDSTNQRLWMFDGLSETPRAIVEQLSQQGTHEFEQGSRSTTIKVKKLIGIIDVWSVTECQQ